MGNYYVVCKYFNEGNCRDGYKCLYLHPDMECNLGKKCNKDICLKTHKDLCKFGKNVNMEKIATTAGIVLSNLKRKLVSTKNFVNIKNIVLLNILRKLARMKRTARLQVVDTNMKGKLVYLGKVASME